MSGVKKIEIRILENICLKAIHLSLNQRLFVDFYIISNKSKKNVNT